MEPEVLLAVLDDLDEEDLDRFKWHLMILKNFQAICKKDLDAAKQRHDLVTKMFQIYGANVCEITSMILTKINRRDLLEKLPTSTSRPAGASGPTPPSAVTRRGQHRGDAVRGGRGGSQTSNPELKKYFCELTLDINSAHRFLRLSDDNRTVEVDSEVIQPYPDHPDRFDIWCQVVSSAGLSGRCYWEVEWSGEVLIAVTYRGANRKGGGIDCMFGENAQSWSLWCSADGHSVRHNKVKSILPVSSGSSGRVAVVLDWSAGSLSFYKVSSADLIHLHTYNATFSEPLYAGFWFGPRSSVSLCDV